jgi:hypothetical protein
MISVDNYGEIMREETDRHYRCLCCFRPEIAPRPSARSALYDKVDRCSNALVRVDDESFRWSGRRTHLRWDQGRLRPCIVSALDKL